MNMRLDNMNLELFLYTFILLYMPTKIPGFEPGT